MNEPKYKRVLLKISGEALAGEQHRGLDFEVLVSLAPQFLQQVFLEWDSMVIPFLRQKVLIVLTGMPRPSDMAT